MRRSITKQMINYFNIPVEFRQFYLRIALMLKEFFERFNSIYLTIVEHETLIRKIPQFCIAESAITIMPMIQHSMLGIKNRGNLVNSL